MSLPNKDQFLRDVPVEEPEVEVYLSSSGDLIDTRPQPEPEAPTDSVAKQNNMNRYGAVAATALSVFLGGGLYTAAVVDARNVAQQERRHQITAREADNRHSAEFNYGLLGLVIISLPGLMSRYSQPKKT